MYIARSVLMHNGKMYKPGQEVPLADKEAGELLKDRAVALVGSTETDTAIKKARAAEEIEALRTKLTASEKAAADERSARDALEVRVKDLEAKLAASEKAATAPAQTAQPAQPAQSAKSAQTAQTRR